MTRISLGSLDRARPIHLAGVGGSAMSGLACMLRQMGFAVTGTDPNPGRARDMLEQAGVLVHSEQDGSKIPGDASLLVFSAALPAGHPELVAARSRGIPIVGYPEMLGSLMAERKGIAVAGTHGKTTVTAMTAWCLRAAGLEPGFVIGGFVPCLGAGADMGSSELFVVEACEYNRSFLNLYPEVAVVTNIEVDHLDVYADLGAIREAFRSFISHLPREQGVLVYSASCPNIALLLDAAPKRAVSFGIETDAAFAARSLATDGDGTSFEVVIEGGTAHRARITLPGRHNVLNALAAIAACDAVGVSVEDSVRALSSFTGARRRFDLRGEVDGISIVDDYAHHPTELRALIDAARQRYRGRRVVLAFQPHQYSRTRHLMDDFASALSLADRVLVPNIYFARDTKTDELEVSAADLVERVLRLGTPSEHLGSLTALTHRLVETLEPGDVLLTAGAGDIDGIVEPLIRAMRNK